MTKDNGLSQKSGLLSEKISHQASFIRNLIIKKLVIIRKLVIKLYLLGI